MHIKTIQNNNIPKITLQQETLDKKTKTQSSASISGVKRMHVFMTAIF